jgi:tetratricopeptide (TPR) repeat protein
MFNQYRRKDESTSGARARQLSLAATVCLAIVLGGCAVAPTTTGPSPDELARQQRLERANNNLGEGLKQYESGVYDDAMKSFLLALDSGLLAVPQQTNARKHMAFIHCVSSREANCKEEFEKAFAVDSRFELTAAEAGHPIWGPVFRTVKAEIDGRRFGRAPAPPAPKVLSAAERMMNEAATAYDKADYNGAIKIYGDALKETIPLDEQLKAHKFIAFSYCLTARQVLCRQEFERLLQKKADFDLAPAEAGHPSWGPSFRQAKARQRPAGSPAIPAASPPAKR